MNIAQEPVNVDLRPRVGLIEEDDQRRDNQQVETMKAVTEQGKILKEQARILANHDRRFDFHHTILSNQKEILKQLRLIQV